MTEATVEAETPLLSIKGLDLKVPDRVLLEGADLTLRKGELVLLVGPSGAGKSLLLKVITGLLGAAEEAVSLGGELYLDGVPIHVKRSSRLARSAFRKTGLVFQDHALFDELDVRQNVLFARDHGQSSRTKEAAERAFAFLDQAGIPLKARVRELSGGQRQRVAIARSLAADPELLVYDEPTSSLDPRSSKVVAELIKAAQRDFEKTSLIVSHDYEPFEGIVDRVIFLDPASRALVEIPFEKLGEVMAEAQVEEAEAAAPPIGFGARLKASAKAAGLALERFLAETWLTCAGGLLNSRFVAPWGGRPAWFFNKVHHYARLTFLGSAVPYMLIAGAIVGFVVTYFTFTRMPHGEHFQDEILPVVGGALYRVVIPVLASLLIAGRTGAALASDLGHRVLGKQVMAMRSFGVDERPYLLTPILWMNALGTLILDLVAFFSASVTSAIVFTLTQPERSPFFWSTYFFELLRPEAGSWFPPDSDWVLAKLLSCSLVISAVAYRIGASPKRSGAEVSFATTSTVYWATVGVLFVHFLFAFFEF